MKVAIYFVKSKGKRSLRGSEGLDPHGRTGTGRPPGQSPRCDSSQRLLRHAGPEEADPEGLPAAAASDTEPLEVQPLPVMETDVYRGQRRRHDRGHHRVVGSYRLRSPLWVLSTSLPRWCRHPFALSLPVNSHLPGRPGVGYDRSGATGQKGREIPEPSGREHLAAILAGKGAAREQMANRRFTNWPPFPGAESIRMHRRSIFEANPHFWLSRLYRLSIFKQHPLNTCL